MLLNRDAKGLYTPADANGRAVLFMYVSTQPSKSTVGRLCYDDSRARKIGLTMMQSAIYERRVFLCSEISFTQKLHRIHLVQRHSNIERRKFGDCIVL